MSEDYPTQKQLAHARAILAAAAVESKHKAKRLGKAIGVRDIPANVARVLWDHDIRSLEDLFRLSLSEIGKMPGIGSKGLRSLVFALEWAGQDKSSFKREPPKVHKPLPPSQRSVEAWQMREAGYSVRDIARHMGVTRGRVDNLLNAYKRRMKILSMEKADE